jgi:hypothetical protein
VAAVNVGEVVDLMVALVGDDGAFLGRAGGAQALAEAQEIQATLMALFEGNLGHVVLWEQFLRTPGQVALAVAGVLQTLVESDRELDQWLWASMERYRQATEGAS